MASAVKEAVADVKEKVHRHPKSGTDKENLSEEGEGERHHGEGEHHHGEGERHHHVEGEHHHHAEGEHHHHHSKPPTHEPVNEHEHPPRNAPGAPGIVETPGGVSTGNAPSSKLL